MDQAGHDVAPVVLVVDDEPDIRETLIEVLSEEGYQVYSASNGQEAFASLEHARPCVILLDLMMPVMSGWEFRRRQQEDPALADIPVVVLSADGRISQKAESIGASGFLSKPFELDNLLGTVSGFCC